MKKNAVVGASVNFNTNELKNFIVSFRSVNTSDDLILFVDEKNINNLKDSFIHHNVIFKNFNFYEFVDTPVHNSRYLKYLEFVFDNNQYENIFLSDTKDVIFQSNPFENLPTEYLYFFKEDSGIQIFNDYFFNSWWIHSSYGAEILNQVAHNNIICSGTILGSYNEILKLLIHVKNELLRIKNTNLEIFKNTILDQAIINCLGYLNLTNNENLKIQPNGMIVGTLGASLGAKVNVPHNFDITTVDPKFLQVPPPQDKILFNGINLMINDSIPSIIHQYDRHKDLKEFFDNKYQLDLGQVS